jgi:GntR family transcriptional regulator
VTEWNTESPIYLQVREELVGMILDGLLKDGDPLPSVRTIAHDYRLNPLTVLRAFQMLEEEGIVEKHRGRGMFVRAGGCDRLRALEREAFRTQQWPRIRRKIARLGLDPGELLKEPPSSSPLDGEPP